MQWTNLSIADHCVFGGARLCHGAIGIHLNVGVDPGINCVYARQVCANKFSRRDLVAAQGGCHCAG